MGSTKLLLKSAPESMKHRDVLYTTVAEKLGGISKCSSSGELPRGRQQVKDFSRYAKQQRTPSTAVTAGQIKDDDPWFRLLCEGKKQASLRTTAFIRDVRVAPEPLCVMATNRQIKDLKRFCCHPSDYKHFTVDPTFNIGEYNVTPITYQHLILENKRDGKHPSFIGPVMIHEKKTKDTYAAFSGTLRNLEPELRDVLAFGTDDEEALHEGFKINFDRSINLLCEIHLRKSIEKKLLELGITGKKKTDIAADIFGQRIGTIYESGLIDASNDETFYKMLESLKERWSNFDEKGRQFYEWFCE